MCLAAPGLFPILIKEVSVTALPSEPVIVLPPSLDALYVNDVLDSAWATLKDCGEEENVPKIAE